MSTTLSFSSFKHILRFPFKDSEKKGRFAVGIVLMLAGYLAYSTSFFTVAFSGDENVSVGVLVSFAIMLFGMFASAIYGVLVIFPYPSAQTRTATKDRFVALFDLRTWWPVLHRYLTNYLVIGLLIIGLVGFMYLAYLLMYVAVSLCFIAIFLHPLLIYSIGMIPPALLAEIYCPALLLTDNLPGKLAIPPENFLPIC